MPRIIKHRGNVFSLEAGGHCEAAEARDRGIEIEQFDQRIADRRLLARDADDERHPRGLIAQADLRPEIVLTKMITVVAGEDHNRVVRLAGFFQRGEHLAHLRIHVGDAGIISAERLLLPANVHFHIHTGLVVDAGLRDVVPIARHLRRQL